MKNLPLIWFIASILLVTTAFPVHAQSNSDVSVSVSTEVISSIELITIQSMKLSETDADNNVIRITPLTSNNAGKMIAIGTPNSDIRISFLESRELTRIGGSENLLFNYQIAGNTDDDQSTSEILDQENRDFEFNGDGRFYLWIGGNVDVSTAVPGNYRGEFTLEIEYI